VINGILKLRNDFSRSLSFFKTIEVAPEPIKVRIYTDVKSDTSTLERF